MFCPNCGTENQKEVKFCRKCGVSLALVSQALTGQLPEQTLSKHERRELRREEKRNRPPSMEKGVKDTIAGVGFIVAAIAVFFFAPAGKIWFWSFFFPAFGLLSKGIPEIMAARKYAQGQSLSSPNQVAIPPPPQAIDYRAPQTGELLLPPPPSVTEGTTKFFDQPNNRTNES